MNVNHAEFKANQVGGLKPQTSGIYCSSKPYPPKNKVRGRPNACFKSGLRSGFAAGIQQGLKQGMAKAKVTRAIRSTRPQADNQRQPRRPPAQAPAPAPAQALQNLSLGVLRNMLREHLEANPDLPKEYRLTSGMYSGQMKGVSYIGKPDYIIILRRYRLGV